jgi:hypothetical protein
MENFITGYPGHEHEVRAALKRVLGEEKYEFFFDKVGSKSWRAPLTPSSSSISSTRTTQSSTRPWVSTAFVSRYVSVGGTVA